MNVLERDLFTDPDLIQDPSPYYAELRKHEPVMREPHHGVFMVRVSRRSSESMRTSTPSRRSSRHSAHL